MRLFVRLSLIGLLTLVAAGFAMNMFVQGDGNEKMLVATSAEGACVEEGISLTVDFGSKAESPTITRCVKNFTGTSWDIFKIADLKITGTQKYPVGFVCRIEDFPDEAQEPCQDTPKPSVGSWSYFNAQPGDSDWKYSTWGAATHRPLCGSAEAWVFRYQEENLEIPPSQDPQTSVCTAN